MGQLFQLDVGSVSDVGRVREANEDSWGAFEQLSKAMDLPQETVERKGRLYAVADGMGGHAAGEVASKRAIGVLFSHYYDDPDIDLVRSLERAFWSANAEIYAQAATNPNLSGMGTTLVAAVIQDDTLIVANVGDSRAYLVRDGRAEQVSRDHSWVNEQVEAGLLTEAEAQVHVYRNIITRSLGSRPDVAVDTFTVPLQVGDALMLCTDGVCNDVTPTEISALVSQAPHAAVAATSVVARGNERGGVDNLTAVVVRVVAAERQRAQVSWLVTGLIAGLVLVGAFVVCVSAGLVPVALVPQLWTPSAGETAAPGGAALVDDAGTPASDALLATPTRILPPIKGTLPTFGWKVAAPTPRR